MPQTYYTYANKVPLKSGEVLHFQLGKGYYSAPKTPPRPVTAGPTIISENGQWTPTPPIVERRPTPPPVAPPRAVAPPAYTVDPSLAAVSPADILAQANAQAQSGIDPQLAAVRDQQARALAATKANEEAVTGFNTAAAQLLANLAPGVGQSYDDAAAEIGDLAKGMSSAAAERLQSGEDANADFSASQGGSYTPDISSTQLGDTIYYGGGFIPGEEFAKEGAAAESLARMQPAIQLATGRQQLAQTIATGNQTQDQLEQQLQQIAQTFPSLRDQALQALQSLEIQKAQQRETNSQDFIGNKNNAAQLAEQARVDTANIASQKRQDATQARAERVQEQTLGYNIQKTNEEYQYKWASLSFQTKKQAQAAQQAQARGQAIDAAASKVAGHLVDRNGNDIHDAKGKLIPVAKSTTKSGQLTANERKEIQAKVYADARDLRGDPVTAPSGSRGKYIAAPGATGVFPGKFGRPNTTNDPNKARRDGGMTFAQALDYLVGAYGVTRSVARSALIANGWKPDGQRPNKSVNPKKNPKAAGPPAP